MGNGLLAYLWTQRLSDHLHFTLILKLCLGLLQELRQGKADLPTIIEGFFMGLFEAKGLDRSGFVVRAASPAARSPVQQSLHCACSGHCCCRCSPCP